MRTVRVYHNSRSVEGTVTEDQSGLERYEIRVDVGERGVRILNCDSALLIVHKDNIEETE